MGYFTSLQYHNTHTLSLFHSRTFKVKRVLLFEAILIEIHQNILSSKLFEMQYHIIIVPLLAVRYSCVFISV